MKQWITGVIVLVIACIFCTAGITNNRGGGPKDVVEAYYADLVDKSSELKQLEKEVQASERNLYEMESRFNSYNRPSTEYYTDASSKSNGIRDAALKATVQGWVTNSRTQYATRIADLTKVLQQLRDKKITQDDYHIALKIAATLPIIEKYQQQNLPADAEYQKLLSQLDETIKKLQGAAKR